MRMSRTMRGSTQATGPLAVSSTVPVPVGKAHTIGVAASTVPEASVRVFAPSRHSMAYATLAAGRIST